MNNTQIDINTIYYLEIFVTDSHGDPVTGLTISYQIYKSLDNSLIDSGSMIEIGNGIYQKAYTFTAKGQYRIIYITPYDYTNEIEGIMVIDKVATQIDLSRILGLVQENFRIFDPVYDTKGNMTNATVKIYPNAIDCENDTNEIAEYEVTSVFNAQGLMTAYKSKKI